VIQCIWMRGEDAALPHETRDSDDVWQRGFVLACFRLIMAQTVELSLTTSLREKLAGVRRAALFVHRFRRFRRDEFLETRIVPERIEHWIEPEQRRSAR
jgi:hypothetical protein